MLIPFGEFHPSANGSRYNIVTGYGYPFRSFPFPGCVKMSETQSKHGVTYTNERQNRVAKPEPL